MYSARIESVMGNLAERGLTQLLVCDPLSVKYLTSMYENPHERFLGVLLRKGKQPVMFANNLFRVPEETGCEVIRYFDTEDPIALLAERCDPTEKLGCDKNLAARFLIPMIERGVAAGFVLASDAVDDARAIKDERERAAMREASAINDAAMARFRELICEGVTEREIAAQMEAIYRELGASGHSFEPIVAFGANAANNHHMPTDAVLKDGDVVLFDVGCLKDDYCADMTRTFLWRSSTDEQRCVYELVRQANEAGKAAVKPGARFCDIDAAARSIIEEAGYGPYFNHRLGHQIGLDVHEPGDVSAAHDAPMQPGMCFSIEPGIYLPGKFGVRIEDLVLVTEDGCEVLNSYPRELEVLGL